MWDCPSGIVRWFVVFSPPLLMRDKVLWPCTFLVTVRPFVGAGGWWTVQRRFGVSRLPRWRHSLNRRLPKVAANIVEKTARAQTQTQWKWAFIFSSFFEVCECICTDKYPYSCLSLQSRSRRQCFSKSSFKKRFLIIFITYLFVHLTRGVGFYNVNL